eukprot:CAMPEP_0197630270 /NCGR_PEP_ID=MMETSP1338-20131121/7818_1 /TAXON_ID=43686 ORGANISM="Pelagodinium beii, Strain RCC1491" /NCGR_SAMPLE_ID=MMETSP1338 /ASSEMBLY_ACC=CAM_ASM_000754 /LENGTH=37 /DNA_ID= /DNA_START= /DNA_END= /DNA_ORIENTATION=
MRWPHAWPSCTSPATSGSIFRATGPLWKGASQVLRPQ